MNNGKIMAKFAALRPWAHSYLINDNGENEKAKTKKACHKTKT